MVLNSKNQKRIKAVTMILSLLLYIYIVVFKKRGVEREGERSRVPIPRQLFLELFKEVFE